MYTTIYNLISHFLWEINSYLELNVMYYSLHYNNLLWRQIYWKEECSSNSCPSSYLSVYMVEPLFPVIMMSLLSTRSWSCGIASKAKY